MNRKRHFFFVCYSSCRFLPCGPDHPSVHSLPKSITSGSICTDDRRQANHRSPSGGDRVARGWRAANGGAVRAHPDNRPSAAVVAPRALDVERMRRALRDRALACSCCSSTHDTSSSRDREGQAAAHQRAQFADRRDDLIAVMTPDVSPRNITFTRRTNNIEEILSSHWGKSDGWVPRSCRGRVRGLLQRQRRSRACEKMIARRREMLVLDALGRTRRASADIARRAEGGHHDI